MSRPIEDYALIGDLQSAALVSRDGSIDWLCLPRFDSEACFAALLGDERHGYWHIGPAREITRVRRRYRPGTLVLETEFTTASGVVRLIDCMPPRGADPVIIRLVEGVAGRVDMRMTLAARFEYGLTLPRVQQQDAARRIVAGGQSLWIFSPLEVRAPEGDLVARFSVGEGDRVPVAAVWRPLHLRAPAPPPASALITQTADWWRDWAAGLAGVDQGAGEWQEAVIRSLITLRALCYAPHRRPGRGADHRTAPAGVRGAQLGLPLLLDPRRRRCRGGVPGRRRRPGGGPPAELAHSRRGRPGGPGPGGLPGHR